MFEFIVGVIGAAIAAAQVFTEEKEARKKQIFVATLVGSVVIATSGLIYAGAHLAHSWMISGYARATLEGLNSPKTYDELLKIRNLNFQDGDDVIGYLDSHAQIDIDFPNMRGEDGVSHIVRTFKKKTSSR